MKRDLNLVREILLRLEPLSATPDQPAPLDVGKEPLDIPTTRTSRSSTTSASWRTVGSSVIAREFQHRAWGRP